MSERPRLLFVARTGEYLGVLRSPLASGGDPFLRRDGSIGHVFRAPNTGALYALDARLMFERVVPRSTRTVRPHPARATPDTPDRVERAA
jgi:hypothetical protein